MIRQISLITLREGASPDRVAGLESALATAAETHEGILHSQAGRHLPGSLCADYTWDVALDGQTTPGIEVLQSSPSLRPHFHPTEDGEPALVAHVDTVRFEHQHGANPEPAIGPCIKRTLLLSVQPGTPADQQEQFERDMMRMPEYIPEIRNWALSRTDTALQPTAWTHVWEQEYEDLAGLQGGYMTSPFHWGLIDGWFDPECPKRIVENRFAHVYCEAPASVLAWESVGTSAPRTRPGHTGG